MTMRRALAALALMLSAQSALAGPRPELDASQGQRPSGAPTALAARARASVAGLATPSSYDERYGVPTMIWADRTSDLATAKAAPNAAKPSYEGSARRYLGLAAGYYRLQPTDVASAPVRWIHDTGNGGVIVSFKQQVDGIDVFRDEVKVLMTRDQSLVAVSGYIPGQDLVQRAAGSAFALAPEAALAIGLEDFAGAKVPAGFRAAGTAEGGYQLFDAALATGDLADEVKPGNTLRVRKTFFHLSDALVPAYETEYMSSTQAYAYVIDATTGAILYRHDIMASDVFNYRVWAENTLPGRPYDGPMGNGPTPHPTGLPDFYAPPFVSTNLRSIQNGPISTNDPWLPPGAVVTTGNNVDAYADLVAPDGYSAGDLRDSTTAANTFDRTYDVTLSPSSSTNQRMAAITQLFYNDNFFHDWYYDSGFDELSGNGQTDNYGRGGLGNDPIHAEAQDYGGTNNANMSTPSDGASGRMQMYIFNPSGSASITATGTLTGTYAAGVSTTFGPQTFNITGNAILGVSATAPINGGCSAFTNAGQIPGKIVVLDRGTCSFNSKAATAQAAGAIGCIIIDNAAGSVPPGLGGTGIVINIPVMSMTLNDGNALKAAMLNGTVTLTLARLASLSRDGSLDNQIVAHEWGHFISNRLVGNAAGLSTNMAGGLGEGWADFHAMLMTVRPEDIGVGSNANWNGVYGLAGYALYPSVGASNSFYYGVRRVPYSTDLTKNGLTFQHIANGVALPSTVPTAFGLNGANNAEVHNTGEVWCTMLWECYASLLRDNVRLTFAQAQSRMKDYLVAAYKLTPNAPTLLEARDALLAAAYARDITDFSRFATAFAKRGAGTGAIAPDRFSATNVGVTESYVTGGDLTFTAKSLVMDLRDCDGDGRLDNGEMGRVVVTLRNTGTISLANARVTLSSTNPHVSFPQGATVRLSPVNPYQSATTYCVVAFNGATTAEVLDLTATVTEPGLVGTNRASTLYVYANADDGPSANETAEGNTSGWTAGGTPTTEGMWTVAQSATSVNHLFYGADIGTTADHTWTSPPIQIGATGTASFTFKAAYDFEKSGTTYYDGGIIEISNDNGVTWTDLGTSASPTYGGVLATGNPLAGRNAYVSTSTGFPTLQTFTVSLGAVYAGQTVRIRFRVLCDSGVGAGGWYVDDLVFTNIANQPFGALIDDIVPCAPLAVDDSPRELSFAVSGANPALGHTAFRFGMPAAQRAELAVFDITGRRVATLAQGLQEAGWHTASWTVNDDGSAPAAGIYFARLVTDARTVGSRIVMLK